VTVEISANGQKFSGWQRGSLRLTMQELANSFDVEYLASIDGAQALSAGDPVKVLVNGHVVIDGYVDTTDDEDTAEDLRLKVGGRSRTMDLVDCSAAKQQFSRQTALSIAMAIARPFEIEVDAESDVGEPFPNFSVQHGETGADAILRASTARALYPYARGGMLVLGRAGSVKASMQLVRGQRPLLRTARSDSWYSRYSEYVFKGQIRATDDRFGKAAAAIKRSVTDPEINRYRPLLIQVEAHGPGDVQTRAEVARNQRIGQGQRVLATVHGLTMDDGNPWRANMLVDVHNPVLGIAETLLIADVRMRFGENEPEETELELQPPLAFDIGKNRAAKEKANKRGFYTKP
jgi:prophage tail gpP-like protein